MDSPELADEELAEDVDVFAASDVDVDVDVACADADATSASLHTNDHGCTHCWWDLLKRSQ